jgi:hypothetical protein
MLESALARPQQRLAYGGIETDLPAPAHISRHLSTAAADPLALTRRTRASRLDVVSATPSPSSAPCAPSERRLDTLVTKGDEKCGLAAAYAYGIARNHPFVDGNKRTAAVACELFLELNGYLLIASDPDLYPVFLGLAAGEISEEELTVWLRNHSRPSSVNEAEGIYG